MSTKTEELLKSHTLRVTKVRTRVLDMFREQAKALSHPEIEEEFSDFDRVTLYRTLHSFLENGLLHKVPDDSGVMRYALCQTDCTAHDHFDNHVHFKCESCEKIECLHDVEIPAVHVPDGYEVQMAHLLLQGICPACKK
jgi:Fur family transcriptional regulator, ferric uptake regulator